jgi:hypothetical protein
MNILHSPLVLHEDTFYEYFEPYRHPEAHFNIWGGIGLETYGQDLEIVKRLNPEYLWTVVDAGTGAGQWISTGLHHVNRICYLVTRKSHKWVNVDFCISRRMTSLTPLGLRRQLTKLKRLISDAST